MILSCEDVLNFARSETLTLLCCTDVMNFVHKTGFIVSLYHRYRGRW